MHVAIQFYQHSVAGKFGYICFSHSCYKGRRIRRLTWPEMREEWEILLGRGLMRTALDFRWSWVSLNLCSICLKLGKLVFILITEVWSSPSFPPSMFSAFLFVKSASLCVSTGNFCWLLRPWSVRRELCELLSILFHGVEMVVGWETCDLTTDFNSLGAALLSSSVNPPVNQQKIPM